MLINCVCVLPHAVVMCPFLGLDLNEWAGMLHHTEGLHNKHIVQNIMVPSVKMLYPHRIFHYQQDRSSRHDSRVGQERILLQATAQLVDWP